MRSKLLYILLILLTYLPISGVSHAETANNNPLKAAFIYYFLLYTQWSPPPKSYNLCVWGTTSLSKDLEQLSSREIAGKPIKVVRFLKQEPIDNQDCTAVYIAADAQSSFRGEILLSSSQHAILTITDGQVPAQQQGLIHLETMGDKLTFAINESGAKKLGLTYHYKLLRLAYRIF